MMRIIKMLVRVTKRLVQVVAERRSSHAYLWEICYSMTLIRVVLRGTVREPKGARCMATKAALSEELEVFEAKKPDLLKSYPGLFVLVKGHDLLGPYPSAEAAYEDGLQRFGLRTFLVKQVLEEEPVGYVPMFSLVPRHDARL